MSAHQLSTPNHITRTPVEALTSPVTAAQLAVYLGLTADISEAVPQQAMLDGLLLAATGAVQGLSGVELVQRNWQYRADRYPAVRDGFGGLAPLPETPAPWIDLGITPIVSVESVTVAGEAQILNQDYRVDGGRVFLSGLGTQITIDFTAGKPTEWGKQAILATAAYLYEHRGGCEATDAVRQSTAWGLIKPYRVFRGGL